MNSIDGVRCDVPIQKLSNEKSGIADRVIIGVYRSIGSST